MEDTNQKKKTTKKTSTDNTRKKQTKTSGEDGEEKQVLEVGLYCTVQLLDCWQRWTDRQYMVVDRFMGDWVICEHWYSQASDGTNISQLGVPLIVKADRLRIHHNKPLRCVPWDWYKTPEDFVRFMKGRVGGLGDKPRSFIKTEIAAYE